MTKSNSRRPVLVCRSGHYRYTQVGDKYWGELPSGEIHQYDTITQLLDAINAENKAYDDLAREYEERETGRRIMTDETSKWLEFA